MCLFRYGILMCSWLVTAPLSGLAQSPAVAASAPFPCRPVAPHWLYAAESVSSSLQAEAANFAKLLPTARLVELPHRQLLPNTALWYALKIPPGQAGYLQLTADDGQQLWQGSERRQALIPGLYPLTATHDSSWLLVRVINNAVAGGLSRACLLDTAASAQLLATAQERTAAVDARGRLQALAVANRQWQQRVENMTADSLHFTAWGDSQGGWDTFALLVGRQAAHRIDFSIGLGDLTANGSDPMQWESFFERLSPLIERQIPCFLLAGNHDYDGYADDLIARHYLRWARGDQQATPWFSWQAGPATFIALDPNATFPLGFSEAQQQWLQTQFASPAWQQARWRFLLIHQPPYGQGWPGYAGDDCIQQLVEAEAERQRIDFALSGHIHDYERLRKNFGQQTTHFFVLGGAGGGLEPPASNPTPDMDKLYKQHHYALFSLSSHKVEVTIYDSQGTLIDQLLIEKK
jgi:3',5'-cyclic AMP phosphodiesterase CpdA